MRFTIWTPSVRGNEKTPGEAGAVIDAGDEVGAFLDQIGKTEPACGHLAVVTAVSSFIQWRQYPGSSP